jgi:hypothetical protein
MSPSSVHQAPNHASRTLGDDPPNYETEAITADVFHAGWPFVQLNEDYRMRKRPSEKHFIIHLIFIYMSVDVSRPWNWQLACHIHRLGLQTLSDNQSETLTAHSQQSELRKMVGLD